MTDATDALARLGALRRRWESERSARAFVQLGEELRRQGELIEAVAVLEEGLRLHPGYLSGQLALARCRLERAEHAAAEPLLLRVLTADPTQLVAMKLVIQSFAAQGRNDEAREWMDRYFLLAGRDEELEALRDSMASGGASVLAPPVEVIPEVALVEPGAFEPHVVAPDSPPADSEPDAGWTSMEPSAALVEGELFHLSPPAFAPLSFAALLTSVRGPVRRPGGVLRAPELRDPFPKLARPWALAGDLFAAPEAAPPGVAAEAVAPAVAAPPTAPSEPAWTPEPEPEPVPLVGLAEWQPPAVEPVEVYEGDAAAAATTAEIEVPALALAEAELEDRGEPVDFEVVAAEAEALEAGAMPAPAPIDLPMDLPIEPPLPERSWEPREEIAADAMEPEAWAGWSAEAVSAAAPVAFAESEPAESTPVAVGAPPAWEVLPAAELLPVAAAPFGEATEGEGRVDSAFDLAPFMASEASLGAAEVAAAGESSATDETWPAPTPLAADASDATAVALGAEPAAWATGPVVPVEESPELETTVAGPVVPEATVTLGNLYLQQGHLADAIAAFTAVLAAEPWNAEARRGLRLAHLRQPWPIDAIQLLRGSRPADGGLTAKKSHVLRSYLHHLRQG